MKTISLKLDVINYNALQSDILIGYPSLITAFSFIECLSRKINVPHNKEFYYFINNFSLNEREYQRSTTYFSNVSSSKYFSTAVKEMYSANLTISLSFNLDTYLSDDELSSLIRIALLSMHLSSGYINDYSLFISDNELDSISNLFPLFSLNLIDREEDVVKQVLSTRNENLIISGYQFISDIQKDYIHRFDCSESVFSIPLYSIVNSEAVKKSEINQLRKFVYTNTENQIKIIQKG